MALKMAARKPTLKDLLSTGSIDDTALAEFSTDDTPPPSDVSSLSPTHSLPSSPEYMSQIKDDLDDEPMTVSRGMLDQSRMAMCMFMLFIISINPFGIAFNKFSQGSNEFTASYEGRNILNCK